MSFYADLLGLEALMDHGWVLTLGTKEKALVQVSFASEGGSGTETPDLSIEVDDLAAALERFNNACVKIEYGPVEEPWGVRSFSSGIRSEGSSTSWPIPPDDLTFNGV